MFVISRMGCYHGSKIIPSFFTIKEGSTFLSKPLFPQGRKDVTALRCSEPLRYKVGGASKPCAMVLRDGTAEGREFTIYNLQLIVCYLYLGDLEVIG